MGKILEIVEDFNRDEVVIDGVRYATRVFQTLAEPDEHALYRLRRDGEVVVVEEVARIESVDAEGNMVIVPNALHARLRMSEAEQNS